MADYRRYSVSVLLDNGDGTFQQEMTYFSGVGPKSVAAGDFNNDGKLDLAVANSCDASNERKQHLPMLRDNPGSVTIYLNSCP